MGQLWR